MPKQLYFIKTGSTLTDPNICKDYNAESHESMNGTIFKSNQYKRLCRPI